MLRIQRSEQRQDVTLTVSGRLADDYVAELERLVNAENTERCLFLDLTDVTHVTREGVRLLAQLVSSGASLIGCPEYLRKWISAERD